MKIKFLGVLALVFSAGLFTACDKDDDPKVELSAAKDNAGEWWVKYEVADEDGVYSDIYGAGYTHLYTYNTADNVSDKLWVSDEHNFWDYRVKTNLDPGNRTFSSTGQKSAVPEYDIVVDITDGKILKDAGRTASGKTVDSIAFFIKFEDDTDGFTYRVSGHRRTGVPEDEH
ncbi:lipid-binding protein [Adhaeribacter soli]|uniref:Lipid-binding hydrolase n=1 Tax=Adhaeribacter soli TaxID=2607655 RepID=A0A5N1J3W8_9BACT|nr:lipid-binding protein [Adhaeribacter soli]KAA9340785.1 hypothetical protein F0P94_04990 [Adhaeribacter soli]